MTHGLAGSLMKINIHKIPDEGLDLSFIKGPDWLGLIMPEGGGEDFRTDMVEVSCVSRRLGENVFLQGRLITRLYLACSRCLETVELPVDVAFRYTLTPFPTGQAEEVELTVEDLEYGYYDGDIIDLEPLVYEQVVLQIPMKVLCGDDCRGLCPACGKNRNIDPCTCGEDRVDERLAALKNFKVKK
ncbi:MAG: DUF177 domain-containing protein [Syntrophales bacterium]|nr:DUF177 domain-containing protein [Syntrophales bacterium]